MTLFTLFLNYTPDLVLLFMAALGLNGVLWMGSFGAACMIEEDRNIYYSSITWRGSFSDHVLYYEQPLCCHGVLGIWTYGQLCAALCL
jgi:hypothetical protein